MSGEGLRRGSFPGAGEVGSATCYLLAEMPEASLEALCRRTETGKAE